MPGAFAHMVAADRAKQAAESQGLHLIARSTLKYPQWLQAGTVGPDYPPSLTAMQYESFSGDL